MIKPLEESISSVKEAIENLMKGFTEQLMVLQDKFLTHMTILLKGEVCGQGLDKECGRADSIVGEILKKESLDPVSGERSKSFNNDFVNEIPVCPGNLNPSSFCVVDNVVGVSDAKVRKVREFPSFELLSQESLSYGGNMDSGKVQNRGFCEKATSEVESLHKEEKATSEIESLHKEEKTTSEVESLHKEESVSRTMSHLDDIVFTTRDIKIINE